MKAIILLLVICTIGSTSFAQLMTFQNSQKQVEGVNISSSAITANGVNLTTLGAGHRYKFFPSVKVAVIELLSDTPQDFIRDMNLAHSSVESAKNVGLRISFLRDIPSDAIAGSFIDALEVNNVSHGSGAIGDFIHNVRQTTGVTTGSSIKILLSEQAPGVYHLSYEDSAGVIKTVVGSDIDKMNLLRIWLGEPLDSGVENAKAGIVNGN